MICSICKNEIDGFGHNAQPINDGICCDECNVKVIKRRLFDLIMMKKKENKNEK
jgi:DNA-directed RNA polymerase subunit RPC12/RpoP